MQLLLSAGRAPEAAFFARTYKPSKISEMVRLWKSSVASINAKAADSIADPVDYPNLFEGLEYALKAEEWLQGHKLHEAAATIYPEHALDNESDLVEHMKLMDEQPEAPSEEPTPAADAQDASAVDVTIAPEATAEAAVEKAVEA